MQPNSYDKKAWLYARHRWDYPQPAIDQILESTKIGEMSVVADVGSGPGTLARHFLPIAKRVYAVEPSGEMRKIADDQLAPYPNFKSARGSAEATTLADSCVDLITAGMSIQWFEPEAALREFRRILRPDGWMVIMNYSIVEQEVADAVSALLADYPAPMKAPDATPETYLDAAMLQSFTYTTTRREDEERFVGSLLSTAGAPVEADEAYHAFKDRAYSIFSRCSKDGILTITQRTDLRIGRLRK